MKNEQTLVVQLHEIYTFEGKDHFTFFDKIK